MASEEIGIDQDLVGNKLLNKGEETIDSSAVISPASFSVTQNDYNPASLQLSRVLRLTSSANATVTGLTAPDTSRIKQLEISNVGTFTITLSDANAGSVAGNRFSFGADIILLPNMSCTLIYDQTSLRWRCYGAIRNMVSALNIQLFLSSSTYVVPIGVTKLGIWGRAGAGGGGGSGGGGAGFGNAVSGGGGKGGGGGGAGGASIFGYSEIVVIGGSTLTIIVGAGGVGGTAGAGAVGAVGAGGAGTNGGAGGSGGFTRIIGGVGGQILVSSFVGGTGFTNGTHTGVTFTGGVGTGAKATIVVAGGIITTITFTDYGSGYNNLDVLTPVNASGSPALGAGIGATVTINTCLTFARGSGGGLNTPIGGVGGGAGGFGSNGVLGAGGTTLGAGGAGGNSYFGIYSNQPISLAGATGGNGGGIASNNGVVGGTTSAVGDVVFGTGSITIGDCASGSGGTFLGVTWGGGGGGAGSGTSGQSDMGIGGSGVQRGGDSALPIPKLGTESNGGNGNNAGAGGNGIAGAAGMDGFNGRGGSGATGGGGGGGGSTSGGSGGAGKAGGTGSNGALVIQIIE